MFGFGKKNDDKKVERKKGLTNTLGIDLGTLNTVVAKPSGDKFDLFKIPSVVAVKKDDPSYVLAVGEEAKSMLGRTPEDIIAVRPLRKGVIESVAQAEALLVYSMEMGSAEDTSSIDRIVIGIPGDASEVERNAVEEIGKKAGASYVLVISEGLAAAIGAGLPIAEASGTMVIDIGAGSSDLVVISLGGITDIQTIRWGGDDIDDNIVDQVKQKYEVEIGIHEAEKAKIAVGMVHCDVDMENEKTHVIGKCMKTNKPKEIELDSVMVANAAEPIVVKIIEALALVLERLSPELISGVYNKTVVVGGTSQLKGLKERIFEEVGIPVDISDDPMTVVAKGAAIVAAEPRALEPEVRLKAMK
ncbi:rod shape-determining protein [Methanobacterium alcaliphilum]|uniref:rod shape-determining protein n=1 Tax=Methanobacterium alcaliphilum TaxID=392018 RepID=UPI00200B0223|nr:rod shape-determining protein [Methanobacterium alcaliphilum]MCK9150386.1 rod shape-determining protein [Methanobacterium alcaliphilum]